MCLAVFLSGGKYIRFRYTAVFAVFFIVLVGAKVFLRLSIPLRP